MAITFELWAECEDRGSSDALIAHFSGFETALQSGRTVTWKAHMEENAPYPAGVSVYSPDLDLHSVRTIDDSLELTEAGLRLYAQLREGPGFRFARVAWEAINVPMAELKDYLTVHDDGSCHLDVQCVVDERLYRELGSPKFCQTFRPGYWWTKYYGEVYRPLFSSDQSKLNALALELFPKYFDE